MMKRFFCFILLCSTLATTAIGQAKTRRLPGVINHPSYNQYAPFISHDGNALVFVSDMGEDGALTVAYTSRENDWLPPVELPKNINHRLVYLKGFALSADGKQVYFTSTKSPVVGGYDIMMSELRGTAWTEPQNLMLPINSKTNEGCPSFTPEGNTLYFMRCERMDQRTAGGCKLFRADKKPNGQWDEPKELPANINTGNSQTPRIMADSETLFFSSDKMKGSKGGMDLFVSRLVNGQWTDPVSLDFINTDQDDQFVSVTALGRYIIKEAPATRKNSELVEYLIPDEVRPKGMMKVEGKITDEKNAPVAAYVAVTDAATGKRVYNGRPASDGSYFVYLKEGSKYDFSIDPEQSNRTYFMKELDLTAEKFPQRERLNVILKPWSEGDELALESVQFKPFTSELASASENELKKLVRLIKSNAQSMVELQVLLTGYVEDSVRSSPDLTEMSIDSLHTQVDDIDSLGQLIKHDTTVIKTTYHNDRTQAQAQSIIAYLTRLGVSEDKFKTVTNAIEAILPDEKKLIVKVVARRN